jgi:hypothetical protein
VADMLQFYAWWRPGMTGLVTGVEGGRATATAKLTLHSRSTDGDETADTEAVSFLLAGPRDVAGLHPDAIAHRYPERGVPDAEDTMQPYVEFRDPGLPWRYTPASNPGHGDDRDDEGLRPWLVLVVGTPAEVVVRGDRVELAASVTRAHPLQASASQSHVQESDGALMSRVLSPRDLLADTDYVAAVVPAFRLTEHGALTAAWRDDEVVVPCYDHWTFRTGSAGDFLSLARRLAPHTSTSLGQAPVEYARLETIPELRIRGALAPLGAEDDPLPSDVARDLGALRTPAFDDDDPDGDGRPVVGLPRYGSPWGEVDRSVWGKTLNGDPRHRGVAGLGAELASEEQDTLAEEVGRQAGALEAADHRVRDLAAGLAVGGSLWARRLPDDATGDGSAQQLMLFGPALRRVMTDAGSLAHRATGDGRPLSAAWFSTAARRAMRPGPARTALAAPSAGQPGALLEAANDCPPAPSFLEVGVPAFDGLGVPDFDAQVEAMPPWQPPPPGTGSTGGGSGGGSTGGGDPTTGGTGPGWGGGLPVDIPGTPGPGHLQVPALLAAIDGRVVDAPVMMQLGQLLGARVSAGEALPMTTLVGLAVDSAKLTADPGLEPDLAARITNLVAELQVTGEGAPEDVPAEDPNALIDLVQGLVEPEPEPEACEPVDRFRLAEGARTAFDPNHPSGLGRRRVLDGITGLDEDQPLTPPEFCPGLDLAVWEMLLEHQPDWLLPGIGTIPQDRVLVVQTNAKFIEALLVGFNTELLGQLRLRNLRLAANCTPVRTFWNRVHTPTEQDTSGEDRDDDRQTPEPRRLDDIVGIRSWSGGSELGAEQHRPRGSSSDDLVVVVRGPLLQRYPQTLVYLLAREHRGEQDRRAEQIFPSFRGRLGEDTSYLGFPRIDASVLAEYWVVFEEPPSGFRFRRDNGADLQLDGARYAEAALAPPVRVLVPGDHLIAEEPA